MAISGEQRVTLPALYVSFCRVGALMFGGGYAMLPLLEREVVTRRRWCSHAEMADVYAVAQLVPGVIAVNTAMLIGHRYRGWCGAAICALGAVSAPFLVILAIAAGFERFAGHAVARAVFAGLRPAVGGLLLATACGLIGRTWRTRVAVVVGLAAAGLGLSQRVGPAWVILGGVVAGVAWHLSALRRAAEGR